MDGAGGVMDKFFFVFVFLRERKQINRKKQANGNGKVMEEKREVKTVNFE